MDLLAFEIHKLQQVAAALLSPASIFALPQVAVALAIAFVFLVARRRRRRGQMRPRIVLRAMARRRILLSRSTGADLFCFFINTFAVGALIGFGVFTAATVSDVVARGLDAALGAAAPTTAPDWLLRAVLTVLTFLGYEFGYYVDHRLKHQVPLLWEFHKTHHSAEVLTPLTVYRVHPVDSLIFIDIIAAAVGTLHGAAVHAMGRSVDIYVIDGANAISVAFLLLLAPLQHSQFWMPLRGIAGRLLLSPAHHQIHHSLDPQHYDKNLGSCLAVWDWLFGTLSIPPREPQRLSFGVAGMRSDPHRVTGLLIEPMANALAALGLFRRPALPDRDAPRP
jgi:sterol desaturase/sphingolipid hydroxylase (fatty acid hydroxylase superfamily)